jgi:hypothetical protein
MLIEDTDAVFTLREHCATAQEARQIVQPFVDAWEIESGLATAPGNFALSTAETFPREPHAQNRRIKAI